MSQEVPQKLNMFNFFQVIPGSGRQSATVADSYRFVLPYKFSRCRRSTQVVTGSLTIIWKPGVSISKNPLKALALFSLEFFLTVVRYSQLFGVLDYPHAF